MGCMTEEKLIYHNALFLKLMAGNIVLSHVSRISVLFHGRCVNVKNVDVEWLVYT